MTPLKATAAELAGESPYLGAHVSTAGGMPCALARAADLGCTALQVFVKNQQQWRGRPLDPGDVAAFAAASDRLAVRNSLAHASYLVNLASPDEALRERSRQAVQDEMRRSAALGIPALVVHPGAHMGDGDEAGLGRASSTLCSLLQEPSLESVRILIECTAGQGTSIGHRFEHLARLLEDAGSSGRLGICLDTCHLFAAGYDLRTPRTYEAVFAEFERVVGLGRLCAFHLNDSQRPLASRVDRHAGIGTGHLGRAVFRRLVRDPRFAGLPMLLETPGGQEGFRRDLRLLRRMISRR